MILTGRNSANRSGVTLVELLVVVSIVVLLAAFTIPSMQPAMESRRVRLAARSIRAYLGAAQFLAIEKNRPVGVLFERDAADPRACRILRQVEVPPPYTGDLENAAIFLEFNPNGDSNWLPDENMLNFPAGVVGNPFSPQVGPPLIQSGDVLQLNNQGHRWEIYIPDPTSGFPWRVTLKSQTTPYPPANFTGSATVGPVAFRIFRQPVPTVAAPMVLPRGMVIDLDDSGYENGLSGWMAQGAPGAVDVFAALDKDLNASPAPGVFPLPDPLYDRNDPINQDAYYPDDPIYRVMIMFSPGGGVERIYHSAYDGTGTALPYFSRSTRPIFLMVGKWDRAGEVDMLPEDGLHNWQDAENLWLALNPNTGRVTVADVSTYYADPNTGQLVDNYDPATNRSRPPTVFDSRRYAREAQISRGGR